MPSCYFYFEFYKFSALSGTKNGKEFFRYTKIQLYTFETNSSISITHNVKIYKAQCDLLI